jgi:enoyl-CoA hydratase
MIGVTRVEDVMTIELQRPERRNALNSQLVEELREAVEKAAAENVRVIVLTGQGTVFCAGADLSGDAFAADYPDRLIELHKAMDATPMPVIGAINGPAIGAGLQLAMQCDLRVVAPEAFFQFPTSKYGLALDNWSIRRLCSLVGHGRGRARRGPPRSPAWRRWRCSTPSGCSTTTAPSRRRGRSTRNSSTRRGPART